MKATKDTVSNLIRQEIINSHLSPNERLVEADLAKKYNVSRTIIRTALADLENERLIEKVPNRGARVRAISLEEAIEITEVRSTLEPLAARKAAININEKEIEQLLIIMKDMKEAHENQNYTLYSKINKQLHNQIYESAHQLTLKRLLNNLRAQSVRYQFRLSMMPIRIDSSLSEHIAIVEAVTQKNAELAEEVMFKHINNMLEAYKNMANNSY
ncbi:GntR family transcriptional regulator [Oceanobacillus jeddahense]|uniref:GntR family transcriptional regulator n=1 Tax=Oceanobacillus jeddahense TaxID=1462527 RepID=UPI000595B392|nr:GntR family transcriptional regulator [Oceanobacillus jeddahense]